MRITYGGKVGIGTSTPENILHLHGSSTSFVRFTQPTSGNTASDGFIAGSQSDKVYLWNYENTPILFGTNSTEQMRILETGEIGIGTPTPSQQLHVQGNARVTGSYYDSNNETGTSGQVLSTTGSGTDWVDASIGATGPTGPQGLPGNDGADGATGPTGPQGPTGPLVAGTSGQTLRHNGSDWVANSVLFNNGTNVGVGTTSPAAKLDVNGDAHINGLTVGRGAGSGATNSVLGSNSLSSNTTGYQNVAVGYQSMMSNTNGNYNTAIGSRALEQGSGANNTAIGASALTSSTTANYNTAVGTFAMVNATSGQENTAVGDEALFSNVTGNYNTVLGYGAGYSTLGSGNIFIGHSAGLNETGSNKLYIENSSANATNALIYGEFDADLLRINGTLNINNAFSFPTTDGSAGQVLQTDGAGTLSWQNGGGSSLWTQSGSDIFYISGNVGVGEIAPSQKLHVKGSMRLTQAFYDGNNLPGNPGEVLLSTGTGTEWTTFNPGGPSTNIIDADLDTKVEVEESSDEDIIRFDMGGTEFFNMDNGRLNVVNTGNSVFVGEGAGLNDDLTLNENTFLGYQAGTNISGGFRNVAIGTSALSSNTLDGNNIAIGADAMASSSGGGASIAIGSGALIRNANDDNIAIGYNAINGTGNHTGWRNVTIGNYSMEDNLSGDYNVAMGYWALQQNRAGDRSVAIGASAMQYANSTTTGFFTENTAVGYAALRGSTTASANTGTHNTAIGSHALEDNTSGARNSSLGFSSLSNNTTGGSNVAVGYEALWANVSGTANTATGNEALRNNTTGTDNVALGSYALYTNATGTANVAVGSSTLRSNTGSFNTATGYDALRNNTSGQRNTAQGHSALKNNTSGGNNTAIGIFALESNTTGGNNTAIGYSAHSNSGNYSNSTGLGYDADPSASNQVRVGNSSVTSIGGYAAWSNLSDGRFKTDVQENVAGLEFVMKLRPVTYHLDMDALAKFNGTPDSLRLRDAEALKEAELQVGFVAQEVEEAANETGFDFHGVDRPQDANGHYGLRYAEFVPSMVKAMQEQQAMIAELQRQMEELKRENAELQKHIK